MNLSRTQKRYASILGVCLLVLLVDRVLLAPGEAAADDRVDQPAALPLAPRATTREPVTTVSVPRKPLAERFAQLAEAHRVDVASMSDPFEVPWASDVVVIESPVHPALQTFVRGHRLNAVLALERGGYAIVDGRRLRLGEEIDGFQLVEIRTRSVILESPEFMRVELKLLDASPSAGGRGGARAGAGEGSGDAAGDGSGDAAGDGSDPAAPGDQPKPIEGPQ